LYKVYKIRTAGPVNRRRLGAGEPLILLHGLGMTWQWWIPCLDALATRHAVVAADLPGFGGSAPLPGNEPSPRRLASAVEELAAELGLGTPHVAGISLGGEVALELARRGAARSVCAISPAGFWRSESERRWVETSLRAIRAASVVLAPRADAVLAWRPARSVALARLARRGGSIPAAEAVGYVRALAASDYARTLDAMLDHPFTAPFRAGMPVTVAWGSADRLLFPGQAERAVALVRGARRVVLRGAGHIPTWSHPATTVRAILSTTSG
jgi:pimeloyl-ACP methyl ester carboxylesterase